jgi:hypothetical protein
LGVFVNKICRFWVFVGKGVGLEEVVKRVNVDFSVFYFEFVGCEFDVFVGLVFAVCYVKTPSVAWAN